MSELKYKNSEIKSLFIIPEIILNKKEVPIGFEKSNFEYMLDIAFKQRVLYQFFAVYKEHLPKGYKEQCSQIIESRVNKKKLQLDYLKKIKVEMDRQGVDFILIKGFVISKKIYSDIFKRDFGDCDLIIDKKDFKVADKIMQQLGFTSSLNNNDIPTMDSLECYEVGYYLEYEQGKYMTVELKLGTSSIKEEKIINQFKQNKEVEVIDDEEFYTFNLDDTFILLAVNAYSNFELEFAAARLRDLIDLYLFIDKYSNNLDWQYIKKTVMDNNIENKLYAILKLLNYYYTDYVSKEIIELFDRKKDNDYKYSHGWIRDWLVEPVDLMLDREFHLNEMFFQESLRAYSSRNRNYYNRLLVDKVNIDSWVPNKLKQGIRSKENGLDYNYEFAHDEKNIYINVKFKELNSKVRVVFVIYDIDREMSRKMIEISLKGNSLQCQSLQKDVQVMNIKNDKESILISIDKKYFNVMKNKGRNLSYRMYSVRNFYDIVDYAIINDFDNNDYENPWILYLCD